MQGKIYMMPCPIVEEDIDTIPQASKTIIFNTKFFIVERARTARRYLKRIGHPMSISDLKILEMDKKDPSIGLHDFIDENIGSHDIGVLSEAGCPGIADPGNLVVSYAHRKNITVSPLVGPSSILLALIASGMNGQQFVFHGYLPNKPKELQKKLKSIENDMHRHRQTQIFMEAPYRNGFMLEHCLKALAPQTQLCVACDITADSESIQTRQVKDWKGVDFSKYHKRPAIFLIGLF